MAIHTFFCCSALKICDRISFQLYSFIWSVQQRGFNPANIWRIIRPKIRYFNLSKALTQRCSVRKSVFKISKNSQENNTCASLLFNKRDPGTVVFLWILRNFYEHLFLQKTPGGWLAASIFFETIKTLPGPFRSTCLSRSNIEQVDPQKIKRYATKLCLTLVFSNKSLISLGSRLACVLPLLIKERFRRGTYST